MLRPSEPPFVPPYKTVARNSFYCLHCPDGHTAYSEAAARGHQSHYHSVESAVRDVDYAAGESLSTLEHRRRQWEAAEAKRFAKILDSCVGVDDFCLECGDSPAPPDPFSSCA